MTAIGIRHVDLPIECDDGHQFQLLGRIPAHATRSMLWLPALGVAARHYLPLAHAFAERGVATFLHEWRGNGSSSKRASRQVDWGYRELVMQDAAASHAKLAACVPGIARMVGGHSLGGQLACIGASTLPGIASSICLVGSGTPWWKVYPLPQKLVLPVVYRLVPWLARFHGYLPGHRIGFGGNEAASLMGDWGLTASTGSYDVTSLGPDVESRLGHLDVPIRAALLRDDWMAPSSSLDHLLTKLPLSQVTTKTFDPVALGTKADHFAWMKHPQTVAEFLCLQSPTEGDAG